MPERTLAVVMAGGMGERLRPLTDVRAKPAVPFGAIFRIIDFTLSNCINSEIRQILVLTQYKSHSLSRHLSTGFNFLSQRLDEFIEEIPAQMQLGNQWYKGTADAIRQNMAFHRQRRLRSRARPCGRPHLQDGLPPAPPVPPGTRRRAHRVGHPGARRGGSRPVRRVGGGRDGAHRRL